MIRASSAEPDRSAGGAVGPLWTVLDLLRWTAGYFRERGIASPRLDAECLLAHALGVDRLRLYLDFDKPVMEAERAAFRELVRRRAGERRPVAQLVGFREFWSLPVGVTPQVLVPRPETETLVEALLSRLPGREARLRLADLGTGSGAIALALARERPRAWILATDVSRAALNLAQNNAEVLGVGERIRLLRGDWESALGVGHLHGIAANPPYLALSEAPELAPELRHEPPEALFAGPLGTEVLERLARRLPKHLAPGGIVALELASGQEGLVAARLTEAGLHDVRTHRDLAGRPRVVSGQRPAGRATA